MRTQPKVLFYLPIFLVMTAVSFPVQIMFLYGHSPSETGAIFSKISGLNWLVIMTSLIAAFFIFTASPAAKYIVPALLMLVGFNNGFVSSVVDDFSPWLAYGATNVFFFAHLTLLQPGIKDLLKHPERRWWRTPERKRLCLAALLDHSTQQKVLKAETFDISEGGVFLPFNGSPENLSGFKINDELFFRLNLSDLYQFKCQAKVVRVAQAKGSYPAGIGLSFIGLGHQERKVLRRYLQRHISPHVG